MTLQTQNDEALLARQRLLEQEITDNEEEIRCMQEELDKIYEEFYRRRQF